jgi:hypothetical protein
LVLVFRVLLLFDTGLMATGIPSKDPAVTDEQEKICPEKRKEHQQYTQRIDQHFIRARHWQ